MGERGVRRFGIVVSDPASGVLFHLTRLALSLSRVTEDATVVAFTWTRRGQMPGLVEQLEQGGVEVVDLPALKWSAGFTGLTRVPWRSRCGELDAVITFGPFQLVQLTHCVRREGARVVVVEAMGHDGAPAKAWVGAKILNRLASAVVALCYLERQRLAAAGVDQRRLHVIFNPLDTDWVEEAARRALASGRPAFLSRLGLDPSRRRIVYAASFQPRKRQDIAIRAFSKLASNFPEFDLVLAGSGAEESRLRDLACQLALGERVNFLGRLTFDNVIGLLAAAEVVVHCSNAETFGYSMVEPLVLRRPTVVTRVGIGWELEHEGLAEVVAPDDEEAFRQALTGVLKGGHELEQRLSRARAFVLENCGVDTVARRLAALLNTTA